MDLTLMCVNVSRKLRGGKKNVRHELYVYCHFFKGWLPALVPTSVLLRFCKMPSCAQRAWLRQEMALRVLTPCPSPLTRTVTFCVFKVPLFVPIRRSLWIKTPLRSHLSILWWKNACPVLLKEGEMRRCILTAPSSTRNGCWLRLMLLGTPTLFMHSKDFMCMHALACGYTLFWFCTLNQWY